MVLRADFFKRTFAFKFDARTSRGAMKDKTSWFIKLWYDSDPAVFGIGECGPLPGLSPESGEVEDVLPDILNEFVRMATGNSASDGVKTLDRIVPHGFSALKFGIETALLDLHHGGKRIIFHNSFVQGSPIPINGLIWMGDFDFMMEQVEQKITEGYRCLKLKIGGIHFDEECEILRYIRKNFSENEITLRLDANGSFKPGEALDKLRALSAFHIHSIEQPLQPDAEEMIALCRQSPIPVALDEELIGQDGNRKELLQRIKPHYVILKPTLHGGLSGCASWISLAEAMEIGWWITSALESNIGLNAVCQFTANYPVTTHQGLGTGMLYNNNFPSPLTVTNGKIFYSSDQSWRIE